MSNNWQSALRDRLPALGHRNWIVIADAAYPQHSAPGIETLVAEGDHVAILAAALDDINASGHVRPVVHLDAELAFVSDADAPGAAALRRQLETALRDYPTVELPHEQIIHKLDEAARLFRVLIIKTPMRIPYTSLFIQLDCGYWGAESEARLRAAISA